MPIPSRCGLESFPAQVVESFDFNAHLYGRIYRRWFFNFTVPSHPGRGYADQLFFGGGDSLLWEWHLSGPHTWFYEVVGQPPGSRASLTMERGGGFGAGWGFRMPVYHDVGPGPVVTVGSTLAAHDCFGHVGGQIPANRWFGTRSLMDDIADLARAGGGPLQTTVFDFSLLSGATYDPQSFTLVVPY